MKAREYIEQNFIPWILFLDTQDTLKHFKEFKEEYLLETYNHISKEFRTVDQYELYMFRVNFSKVLSSSGMANLIMCKTPDIKNLKDSVYIIVAYNEELLIYYTVTYINDNTYQLNRFEGKNKTVLYTFSNLNTDMLLNEIKGDLIKS